MNSKITRRVVLGTVIGCLAAGPFVVRALRNKGEVALEGYYPVDSETLKISDLKAKDVYGAYAHAFEEWYAWKNFTGFSAQMESLTQVEEASQEKRVFACTGDILFRFNGGENMSGNEFHCFLEFKNSSSKWTFEMKDGVSTFSGEKDSLQVEPSLLPSLFTLPISVLPSVCHPNTAIGKWIPFAAHNRGLNSYTFKHKFISGSQDSTEEVTFLNGHLSKVLQKSSDGSDVNITSYENYEEIGTGVFYPSRITYSMNRQNIRANCTISLNGAVAVS